MPSFTIDAPNGKSYTIEGDSAEGALAALKKHLGGETTPDKYQQAAIDDREALKAAGAPTESPYLRRALQGATFGAADELLAAARAPAEMIRHGTFNPAEGYRYAKARENLALEDARKTSGISGAIAEIGGGVVGGGALANAGLTLARPGMGVVGRTLASAGEGAGYGGLTGALDSGDSPSDRLYGAGKGILLGGAAGAALPAAMSLGSTLAAPIISNVRARINPTGVAESQLARALQESGRPVSDIERELALAHQEGQGAYTAADALGNAGQRMLSGVSRAPGEGRTMAVEFLNSRQADQGRRLATALREGFDAPRTADQTRASMVENANFEAGHNYAPVKRDTAPIDVSAPVAIANRAISPAADNLAVAQGAVPTDLAARAGIERAESALRDPIGNALKEARSYLAAPNLTLSNVNQAFRAKTNIDMMIAKATENKQGALVGELIPIRDALDEALANTSSNYAAARDAYRVAQQRINALDLGKELGAKPVQPEDAIRQFQALASDQKQPFRAGYADPYVRDALNAPFGSDKSRPLTSEAVKQEFDAFAAPDKRDLLGRRIGREQTMFETRRQATGGSQTADNLADAEALKVDPSLLLHLAHGNISGAVGHSARMAAHAWTGSTPQVRSELARLLLSRGQNVDLAPIVNRVEASTARRRELAHALRSGLVTGSGEFAGQRR